MDLQQESDRNLRQYEFLAAKADEWAKKAQEAEYTAKVYGEEAELALEDFQRTETILWAQDHVVDGAIVCPDDCELYCYRMTDEDRGNALAVYRTFEQDALAGDDEGPHVCATCGADTLADDSHSVGSCGSDYDCLC